MGGARLGGPPPSREGSLEGGGRTRREKVGAAEGLGREAKVAGARRSSSRERPGG